MFLLIKFMVYIEILDVGGVYSYVVMMQRVVI